VGEELFAVELSVLEDPEALRTERVAVPRAALSIVYHDALAALGVGVVVQR
jgi:hypothetical protein